MKAGGSKSIYYVPTVVRLRMKGGQVVQGCDVYIGRQMTQGGWALSKSAWANPFKVSGNTDLKSAIAQYNNYIRTEIAKNPMYWLPMLINMVNKGRPLVLGCWCKVDKKGVWADVPCHGDVIVQLCMETIAMLERLY